MSNVSAINASQRNWSADNQQPTANSNEPSANMELQRLTKDIEKEENELKRINQEFSKYLSDGAQDMAKLKSAEIMQKQMQIQSMQLQISKLEKSGESDESEQSKPLSPKYDEYVRSDGTSEKSPGIYRLEKDENGNQKVVFDRPDSAGAGALADIAPEEAQAAKSPGDALEPDVNAMLPEKPGDKKGGMYCKVNTDKVDAEIKKLQKQKQQAQQELNRVRDNEEKRKDVEQRLAQIEAELSAKDNDAYKKENASVTYSSTPL